MSYFRPVAAWRTPPMCDRPPAPVSLHSCGHLLPATLTSACVLLPVAWEVAFVTCWLRRAHPLGVPRRLKSARGIASCYRPPRSAPPRKPHLCFWSWMRLTLKAEGRWPPMPKSLVRLETMTASSVDASCGGRCRLVAEDVLPG